MKKDPIVVYWSPQSVYWNMFYSEPVNVFKDLTKNRNKASGQANFFACPSFLNKTNQTFSFAFPLECEYEWDFSDHSSVFFKPKKEDLPHVGFEINRPPTVYNSPQIAFNLYYLFFCEESLSATFTSPYFSKPKYTKHASVAPGTMDIGQWFRPYPIEMTFWEEKGSIKFENQEPLFYVEFLTDRPVIMKRFTPNEKILSYADACVKSPTEIGRYLPLYERYERFTKTKTHKLVLKEIKENLV